MRRKRKRGEPLSPEMTSAARENPPASWEGSEHACGGLFALVRGAHTVPIRGASVEVQADFYRCSVCGEVRFDLDQLDEARIAAAKALNESEGLLGGADIRNLRKDLGLTQAGFEQALGLGAKTMVRWETGRVLPSQAMALLLLLIQRDRSAMGFLTARARGEVVAC